MTAGCDVVIAGGGVIGSACAYFLASEPSFAGSIAVIEPDPTYATASTALSVGGIRQQFSTPENVSMSRFAWQFLSTAEETLAVDGEAAAIGRVASAYLLLATGAGVETLRANHALQRALGADVALLSPDQLRARYPWLAVDDIAAASIGLSGEGWIDPYGLLQAFRRKARSLGVRYVRARVAGVELRDRRVVAVSLDDGSVISCGWLVSAAGPRAAEIAAMAGLALPVRPRKRFVFAFRSAAPVAPCPLVVDPSGLYFRPEGDGFVCGISPAAGEPDPDCLDLVVDWTLFEERIWPLLAARVPDFASLKLTGGWAGHYAVNTVDGNAIIGAHPELENLLFANGFSGHGLQQAPAVGRAIAELIVSGRFRTLDLSRLGVTRLIAGCPLAENNII